MGGRVVVKVSLSSSAAFFLLAKKGWTLLEGEANREFLEILVVVLVVVSVVVVVVVVVAVVVGSAVVVVSSSEVVVSAPIVVTDSSSGVVEIKGAMVLDTASKRELTTDETEKCSETDLSTETLVSHPS